MLDEGMSAPLYSMRRVPRLRVTVILGAGERQLTRDFHETACNSSQPTITP